MSQKMGPRLVNKKHMLDMLNARIVPCPGYSDHLVLISGHRYGIGAACRKMTDRATVFG